MSVHVGHVVVGVLALITFAVIVLFNVGFLTTHWITIQETTTTNSTDSSTPFPTTRTCHHGLFYSIDCPESENVFDKTIIGLNIATCVFLTTFPLFWVAWNRYTMCCQNLDDIEYASCSLGLGSFFWAVKCHCVVLCSFFYAVGGLLGLVSAIMVSAKYDHDLLGWSFSLTVAATSIILVKMVLLLTVYIYTLKRTK